MTNTELKSALMDTEQATQAAEPITSATMPAPPEDETQSIYAWSQHDDADTELAIAHRRSWRLPIAVAALAVAAAGTVAAIHFWPHEQKFAGEKTPLPAQTSVPVAQPTQDDKFIATLASEGIQLTGPREPVINGAHTVCSRLAQGQDEGTIIADILKATPGMSGQTATVVADTAINVYCPPIQ